jgi:Na+/H+ antiporter NhaD/arsenite permease-like protein
VEAVVSETRPLAAPREEAAGIRTASEARPLRRSGWRFVGVGAVAAVVVPALAAAVLSLLRPGSVLGGDIVRLAAAVIFAGAYLALALGKVPGLSIDRAGVALVGGCLMVAAGALPLQQAYRAIDFDTITLLLGIMIVVASLRLSGFFALANAWVVRRAHRPIVLLAAIVAVSGVFSAFLVNDAICLVLAPLVLELTLSLKRRPTPYLLAVAMASNVGSVATITGNPQNMMIGSISHIPYLHFAAVLAPVAFAGLLLTVLLIASIYPGEFVRGGRFTAELPAVHADRALVARTLAAAGVMIALFFAGQPPAKAAIILGGLLLLTRRVKSEQVYAEIDWPLLLMFVGLFVVVAGAERALLTPGAVAVVGRLHLDRVPVLSLATAILSNLVSNVPAVLVLKPFIAPMRNHDTAWLTVAMASTLAGNFTVLGSIANLIVVQKAAACGVQIGFWDYFKVGAPLTALTMLFGTFWLWS